MDMQTGPIARKTDPETSHAAAASLSAEGLSKLQEEILRTLRAAPMTDSDLCESIAARFQDCSWSESGIRTRRKELVALGKVRDSGKRGQLPSGRESIIWEPVPATS